MVISVRSEPSPSAIYSRIGLEKNALSFRSISLICHHVFNAIFVVCRSACEFFDWSESMNYWFSWDPVDFIRATWCATIKARVACIEVFFSVERKPKTFLHKILLYVTFFLCFFRQFDCHAGLRCGFKLDWALLERPIEELLISFARWGPM